MNSHLAERVALESVYDRVSPGGVIYFDDYGWNYPELRQTINEFLLDKPERLLHFPSGQSILIKS
jgi:O-methyltransferase